MFPKIKYYNSDIQIWAMKNRFPQFKSIKRGKFDIEFVGDLKVKSTFPLYTVSINYKGSVDPLVTIIRPELVESPPHFYKQSRSLCLYHSKNYKWKRETLIARDIIPWTAAWIYFYEFWLRDDKWYGPEVDHEDLSILEMN